MRLKGIEEQVMVITGASSGIGLSTARRAAQRGAKLVLVSRNDDALQQIVAELNQQTDAIHVAADVGNEAEVRQVAAAAIERFGRIDTWVNNAGVGMFGRYEEVSTEDQRRVFETNFWGVVYGSLAAVPHLKAQGGALINIGSGFSDRATPLQGIYSASKHAVKGFTDSLRVELQEAGAPVSVTLIKPSSVDSMFIPHARNYLEVEPRLPPPVYAPELVAKTILHAAEHPTRETCVGGAAKLLGMSAYYLPGVTDRGMKHLMFRLQKTDKPAGPRERHNLYSAGSGMQESSGLFRTRKTSCYTSAVTHPHAFRALLVGAGLALAAWWHWKRKRSSVQGSLP